MKRAIILDPKMRAEFVHRFDEINVEYVKRVDRLRTVRLEPRILPYTKDRMKELIDKLHKDENMPLDAATAQIMERFARPAYFVQDDSFDTRNTPSTSELIDNTVNKAKSLIEKALPSVGRINLRNHRLSWVGTGWVIAENILVTNRHVATEFAGHEGDSFVFIRTAGQTAKAELDTVREYKSQKEKLYKIRKVLWIAPPSFEHDIAFLSIDKESNYNNPQPPPIDLMDISSFEDIPNDHWIAVIGYPGRSSDDITDQQLIFDGIYDVKRIQPGQIKAKNSAAGIVEHDASTLNGNSGSVVLDLTSGKAIGLHFLGILGERRINKAVAAPVIRELLYKHVLS
ncbi:hypothetical protein GCAAIG_04135 [Candidatus Electronema halotolerans]